MVDKGYWLGGGGFIKIIGGWQNLSVNPPLQILLLGPIPHPGATLEPNSPCYKGPMPNANKKARDSYP